MPDFVLLVRVVAVKRTEAAFACKDCVCDEQVNKHVRRLPAVVRSNGRRERWGQLRAPRAAIAGYRYPVSCVIKTTLCVYFWLRWVFPAALYGRAERGLLSSWGVWAAHGAGFSCRRARGVQGAGASAAAFLLLGPSRQARWLWHTGLVATPQVGVFPGQGSKPCARTAGGVLTAGPPRASPFQNLKIQKEELITPMVERRASRGRAQCEPRP